MTFLQIIFIIAAFVTLGSAVMVVSARNILHAALWLILALLGVAVLFALLQSRFITVVQVIIYVGAIAILIIFGIELTRRVQTETESTLNKFWGFAALAASFFYIYLVFSLTSWPVFRQTSQAVADTGEDLVQLGQAFADPMGFLIPFEIASILLLAAIIGAIYIAGSKRRGKRG